MSTAAITLDGVYKNFGPTEVIRGANLTVERGERLAIIGPNGAGKSTLFNLISGKFPVTSGVISLNGTDVSGLSPFEINHMGLSRSFQVTNIFHRMSVFENIRCALLWPMGYRYSIRHLCNHLRDVHDRAMEVLETIGLAKRASLQAGVLSYADQRALEIGVTIAGGADVILLDEPTAGMSRSETEQAVDLIRKITEGKTLVMVEHDMSVVFGLADRVSVLVYGEILATDKPAAIKANTAVQEAYLGVEVS